MRGSTKKLISRWATKSWEQTPEPQRIGFNGLHGYIEKLKTLWKTDKEFQSFIHSTMKHF